jgi:predicted AAA+ superfamily ATPase
MDRTLRADLEGRVSRNKVRLLFGARQTGKSTLVRSLASDDAFYVNLQETRQRLLYERTPDALSRQLKAMRSEEGRLVIIDEIQRVPAILDEVQHLYDEAPARHQFYLTGSSARKLRSASANLLPGRSHLYRLCPLILPEREAGPHPGGRLLPRHAAPSPSRPFPAARLDELLLFGSLPGIALEPPESRVKTLEAYVEIYLEEEIRREALARDLGSFQRFLELAASESGGIINLSALSQDSGVPAMTLRHYYQILEETFIGYRVPAYAGSGRKRVLTSPKFLFFDTGVRNAAARLDFSTDLLKTDGGRLLEYWVGLELVHRCLYRGRGYQVSFWRTANYAEVDYVVSTPDEVIPVEVKWTESPRETDARHVKQFLADHAGRRAKRGFVVCRCPAPLQLTETIQAIPWWAI